MTFAIFVPSTARDGLQIVLYWAGRNLFNFGIEKGKRKTTYLKRVNVRSLDDKRKAWSSDLLDMKFERFKISEHIEVPWENLNEATYSASCRALGIPKRKHQDYQEIHWLQKTWIRLVRYDYRQNIYSNK